MDKHKKVVKIIAVDKITNDKVFPILPNLSGEPLDPFGVLLSEVLAAEGARFRPNRADSQRRSRQRRRSRCCSSIASSRKERSTEKKKMN